MKLCFVYQQRPWLSDYKSQFNLGILYLAAVLHEEGVQVDFFDANVQPIEQIPAYDVYAFSTTYKDYPAAFNLAKAIRRIYPDTCLIVGGMHPTTTIFDESSLMINTKIWNSVFAGEGEKILLDFCRDYPGVKPVYVENSPETISIERLPYREFLDDSYIATDSIFRCDTNELGTSVMFSRGCCYNCAFCSSSRFYSRKIKFRSRESVKSELDLLQRRYKIKRLRIQDDSFTVNRRFVEQLCEEIARHDMRYRISTRVDLIDDEILALLRDTGCEEIGYGVEVADNYVLQRLNKSVTVEQAEAVLIRTKEFGIQTRGFFMMGLPFENERTFKQNIDFIERTDIDFVRWGCFYPFPGTQIRRNASDYGIINISPECNFLIGLEGPLPPNIHLKHISFEEHYELIKKMWRYLENRHASRKVCCEA